MQFRTSIAPLAAPRLIDYAQHGLTLGSCFADRVGEHLLRCKLPVKVNPSGVLFNPLSVARTIERYASGESYTADALVDSNGRWVSFDHHGSLASTDPQTALANINRATAEGHEALVRSDYLILTLGTAWVFRLRSDGRVVCNCHKRPASDFERVRLNVDEVVEAFRPLVEGVLRSRMIVWTVSPVRHLSDGLEGNALSKAILRLAVQRLCEMHPMSHYFPAYEIMLDDLRDYRFYDRDMVHPSDVAVDYVWERFCESCVAPSAVERFAQIEALRRASEHRSEDRDGEGYRLFRLRMAAEARTLQRMMPDVDFSDEIAFFES